MDALSITTTPTGIPTNFNTNTDLILQLPQEIFLLIFKKLDLPTLTTGYLVSKTWQQRYNESGEILKIFKKACWLLGTQIEHINKELENQYTETTSKIGMWQGGALNLNQV